MCSKKHEIKKTGIYEVMEASKQSGTISVIEKECKCVIKLPEELEDNRSMMAASQYESLYPEPSTGDIIML